MRLCVCALSKSLWTGGTLALVTRLLDRGDHGECGEHFPFNFQNPLSKANILLFHFIAIQYWEAPPTNNLGIASLGGSGLSAGQDVLRIVHVHFFITWFMNVSEKIESEARLDCICFVFGRKLNAGIWECWPKTVESFCTMFVHRAAAGGNMQMQCSLVSNQKALKIQHLRLRKTEEQT